MRQPEGKYVLVKDPNRVSTVHLVNLIYDWLVGGGKGVRIVRSAHGTLMGTAQGCGALCHVRAQGRLWASAVQFHPGPPLPRPGFLGYTVSPYTLFANNASSPQPVIRLYAVPLTAFTGEDEEEEELDVLEPESA